MTSEAIPPRYSAPRTALLGGIRRSPEHMLPSRDGVNPYLLVNDLDASLRATVEHGGEVLLPNTDAGDLGAFAWIVDSEGNRVALNQTKDS